MMVVFSPADWMDLGYSFLVGGDGKVYEGRGWNHQGAHTAPATTAAALVGILTYIRTHARTHAHTHATIITFSFSFLAKLQIAFQLNVQDFFDVECTCVTCSSFSEMLIASCFNVNRCHVYLCACVAISRILNLTQLYRRVTSYFVFRHLPRHNFNSARPSAAQLAAGQRLIACGVRRGCIRSDYRLRGRRDVSSSTCPGKVLFGIIRTWPHFRAYATFPRHRCSI